MKPAKTKTAKRRIFELDLLRGLFIVIIIIDHLQFWPSPLRYITGEGRLWVSAAEGFFLISGLLIGYIRAYKGKGKPLKDLTKLLAKRAGLLYAWGAGITIILTLLTLWSGDHDLLPDLPTPEQMATPFTLLWSVLTMQYFNPWIYFLRLYAIMLLATPIFLWLLRKGYERMVPVLIAAVYLAGFAINEQALQWQALFFGAALIGYHLEAIAAWFRARPVIKTVVAAGTIGLTALTMALSFFFVLGWDKVEDPSWELMGREAYVEIREDLDPLFVLAPFAFGRLVLSFLWFGGLLFLFHVGKKYFMKLAGWLLIPLGESSLSAYILHALLLPIIVIFLAPGSSGFNTLAGIACVLLIWVLIRQPWISKIIPR